MVPKSLEIIGLSWGIAILVFSNAQTMVRRNRNKIHRLNLLNGLWCTGDDILKVEAITYFKDLFCSSTTHVLPQANSRSCLCPQLIGYTC